MSEPAAKLTLSAAQKTANVVRQVLGTPIDKTGERSTRNSYYSSRFYAQITGHAGTPGSPMNYAWSEVDEDGSGGLITKADGRTGTTSTDFAQNLYELSGGQQTQPITNGTFVEMEYSFDKDGNNYWRFDLFQLPPLGLYQGWYGTGPGTVTIQPDYVRAV